MRINLDFIVDFDGIEKMSEKEILTHVLLTVKDTVNENSNIEMKSCSIEQIVED